MARPGVVTALLFLLSITWHSNAQPLHNPYTSTSSVPITIPTSEDISLSLTSDTISTLNSDSLSVDITAQTALIKRGEDPNLIPCKMLQRHQHFIIYPSILTVNAVIGFWQKVALETIYKSSMEAPKSLFTITQGQLQATFSCLGKAVPWDTVHDVALRVIQSVNDGWVDTFDAVYEDARTGFTLWVSFRVLENGLARKRKRPG
ncbi:MAG: hypothetical protein HETSPECPRED_009722 [Heterodermia speciosa]|uniref:Uncharacterized protein n=1 Tax=Heterodermia speciosa TaxID=116794 RepID=A0A8H3G261_9LECA|nr:MAG: hypothetical protein HETSPECPRED_009722 [Heterodermia speciosa]